MGSSLIEEIIYLLSLREFQLAVGIDGVFMWDKNSGQRDFCTSLYVGMQEDTHVRVANVVAVHDDLLTQWMPIKMSKFQANIFWCKLLPTTYGPQKFSKIRSFKVTSFHFPSKKYPKFKTWLNSYAIIIFYEQD